LTTTSARTEAVSHRVPEVHRKAIIVDGHCDTPYRLKRLGLGLADPSPEAQVDLRLLRESGITASFFVSYVPPYYEQRGAADFARGQIDLIHREVKRHPDALTFVADSAGIRRAKRQDKVAILIGVEGGHAIEDSLEILRELYQRGARYLTLTHVNTNNWADSSGDEPRHNGLTEFGRQVVRSMNDLGMIVDISHVADATFYHALETSRAPIIASHSSCRALTRHPRNLTDPMLRDLASAGGVCMINFYTAFVNDQVAQKLLATDTGSASRSAPGDVEELPDDRLHWEDFCRWYEEQQMPPSTIDDVIDHIAHAAEVAGVDAVGIGSDFDGVPALPQGITDISHLPALTERLMERGFRDEEIEKILGGNFLRVFAAVEAAARPL
jgi:membrane dipeptidase